MNNFRCVNPLYNQFVQQQYENKQSEEIAKAVKAVSDLCDAVKNIAPEYQNQAFIRCISKMHEKSRE